MFDLLKPKLMPLKHLLKSTKMISILILIVSISSVAQDDIVDLNNDISQGEIVAEVLWVSFNRDGHQLKISEYINDEWSDPKVIYSSKNSLTSPAIGTSPEGAKLIIWTEQIRTKTELKFITRSENGLLQQPETFTDQGFENFAASIIYDTDGIAWVFWSSTVDELSDIYFVRSQGVGWSMPERINLTNDVPDLHPQASITKTGMVEVNWSTYSFEQGAYINETFTFENNSELNEVSELVDSVVINEIPIPSFLPAIGLFKMHFPTNKMIQSASISVN